MAGPSEQQRQEPDGGRIAARGIDQSASRANIGGTADMMMNENTANDVKQTAAVAVATNIHNNGWKEQTNRSKDRKRDLIVNYSAAHYEELSTITRHQQPLQPPPPLPTSSITTASNGDIRQQKWHNNDSQISMQEGAIRTVAASFSSSPSSSPSLSSVDIIDSEGRAANRTAAAEADSQPIGSHTDRQVRQASDDAAACRHHLHSGPTNGPSSSAGSPNSGSGNGNGTGSGSGSGSGGGQWMMNMAAQTTQEMRQRVSMASDQLGLSLRQFYASASTMAANGGVDVPPSYHNIPGIVPYYRGRSSGPPPSYDDVINPYAPPPTYQSLFGQMREASKNSRSFMDLLKRLVILSTIGCSLLLAFVVLVPFSMIVVGATYLNDCRVEHIPGFLLVGGLVWATKNIIHCCSQCHDIELTPDEYGFYEAQQQRGAAATDAMTGEEQPTDSTGISVTMADNTSQMMGSAGTDQQHLENPVNLHSLGITAAGAAQLHEQSQQQQPTRNQRTNRRIMKKTICESLLNCILFGWFVAGCVIVFRSHNPDFDDPSSARFCNRTVYMYTFWLITSGLVVFSLFVSCICCLVISSAIATRQDDDLS